MINEKEKMVKGNFNLKDSLIRKDENRSLNKKDYSLKEIESWRLESENLTSSKNGLEVICGDGSDVGSM